MADTTAATEVSSKSATTEITENVVLKKITKPYLLDYKAQGRIVVVLDGKVYDLTDFYGQHPGGP
jgi:cytochrome b involved in lipid metabolism